MRWPTLQRLAAVLALALVPVLPSRAAPADPRIDRLFAAYASPASPGCALAVVRNGRIAYEKGYGSANLELGVPITPGTVFDIGSVSKQFTAMSIVLLAQDGRLGLDDEIHRFLPELPDYGQPLTLRHLLHHLSGLRSYTDLFDLAGVPEVDQVTDDDALDLVRRQRTLNFPPGQQYLYSDTNYFLLALVVRRVSGRSLAQFAHERIFAPLGMAHTHFHDDHTLPVTGRATGYARRAGRGYAIDMSNFEPLGDGAVLTTVEDMARWERNFDQPRVGGAEGVRLLLEPGVRSDGSISPYAMGLIHDQYRGVARVQHTGEWAGYRASFLRFPGERLAVIALCNQVDELDPMGLSERVADRYLRAAQPVHAVSAPEPLLQAAPGAYWNAAAMVHLRFVRLGDTLALDAGGGTEPLVYRGDGVFEGSNSTTRYVLRDGPGGMTLRWVTDDSDPVELARAALPDAPLVSGRREDLAGQYSNEDLHATWTLALQDGRLQRRQWLFPGQTLRPIRDDTFEGDTSEAGYVLRFTRDAGGRVDGFDVATTMVRPLHFSRLAAPAADAEQAFRDELARDLGEGMPGVSVALATRQGVIWTGAAGFADLQTRAPAHAGYLYGIGSITKVFVACVVQQLADEGRLDLDRRARDILGSDVVDDIPGAATATLRQLLQHTSGVPTWEFDADWIRRGRGADLLTERPWRKDETLEYLRHGRHPATSAPGAAYAYSNSNYTLLGLVVEKVTGHDLVQELHARVLDPLALADVRLEGFEPLDAARLPARYHFDTPEFRRDAGLHPSYRAVAPGLVDVSSSNLSTEWAAGAMVATARDLAAFTLALRDGRAVGPAALRRMEAFIPTHDDSDPGSEVGEGLFREQLEHGWLVGMDGGVLGFGAVMGWLEQEDLVIVVMTNVGSMHSGEAAFYPLRLVKTARFLEAARALARQLTPPQLTPPR